MSKKDDGNILSYADKAFIAFHEIMSSKQNNMLENVNRANKGELFVLRFLFVSNTDVFPSELSAALGASTARISALLGALEKKGQIVRSIDKSNRRNILVTITEAGRDRAKAEMKQIQRSITQVFDDMGESDTAEFIRLASKFFDLLQKYIPEE